MYLYLGEGGTSNLMHMSSLCVRLAVLYIFIIRICYLHVYKYLHANKVPSSMILLLLLLLLV